MISHLTRALTLGCLSLIISLSAYSQNHKIAGVIHGLSDTTIYLASYYGNKLYYNDTTRCDAKGNYFFKGKTPAQGGKYAVVMPGPKYFDILVTTEDIFIEADSSNDIDKIVVKKSVNNKVYYDYLRYLSERRDERSPIEEALKDSTISNEQKETYYAQLRKLNDQVVEEQKRIASKYADELVGKMIRMTMEVDVPSEISESEDAEFRYRWYLDHYWDNIDLNDSRLVHDQMFHTALEKYINKIIIQIPDTVSFQAKRLIERVKDQPDIFKYVVHYVTYNAETSKIMCMDRVFVDMVDTYYATGLATWMDPEKNIEIVEAADKKRPTLCGEIAPNIILPDTTGQNWVSLHDVDAKYTIIMIWESSCGHCKKEMPKLKSMYEKWHEKGVEVYAIGNDFEVEPWLEFIREKGLEQWINVSDNPEINAADSARALILTHRLTNIESLNFRTTYDVVSTPKLYLLDKDKRIIGKQLSTEQLEDMLTHLEETSAIKEEEE